VIKRPIIQSRTRPAPACGKVQSLATLHLVPDEEQGLTAKRDALPHLQMTRGAVRRFSKITQKSGGNGHLPQRTSGGRARQTCAQIAALTAEDRKAKPGDVLVMNPSV